MSERKLRTKFQYETDKRNASWIGFFIEETKRGSSKMAIYQQIAKRYGYSVGHVGKVIRESRHA